MKRFLITIIFSFLHFISICQVEFNSNIEIGATFSKFKLEKIDIPYPNPMTIGYGYLIRLNSGLKFERNIGINVAFGYSYLDAKANNNNRISKIIDVPIYLSHILYNKFEIQYGISYSRLTNFLIGGWGDTIDLTSLATNRNFVNPYIGIQYKITKIIGIKAEYNYATRDTYLASTKDFNGIDTPPLKANRHYGSLIIQLKLF